MNILLLGSGGREHALAWKMADSPLVDRLYCAPGNPGIANDAELVNLDLADSAAVAGFCRTHGIELVVVGPEAPLVAGLVDALEGAGVACFGPSKAAARSCPCGSPSGYDMTTPTRRPCLAHATKGQTATPPASMRMSSRRLIGFLNAHNKTRCRSN